MSYSIDKERHLVRTRSWGVLTDADILAHKEKLARDPEFCPSMGHLSDGREVQRLEVTTNGVRAMIAHDVANADRRSGHRLAFVVSRDEAFGMARMYSQRSESGDQHIEVFRSVTEAEVWLAGGQAAPPAP